MYISRWKVVRFGQVRKERSSLREAVVASEHTARKVYRVAGYGKETG